MEYEVGKTYIINEVYKEDTYFEDNLVGQALTLLSEPIESGAGSDWLYLQGSIEDINPDIVFYAAKLGKEIVNEQTST